MGLAQLFTWVMVVVWILATLAAFLMSAIVALALLIEGWRGLRSLGSEHTDTPVDPDGE